MSQASSRYDRADRYNVKFNIRKNSSFLKKFVRVFGYHLRSLGVTETCFNFSVGLFIIFVLTFNNCGVSNCLLFY